MTHATIYGVLLLLFSTGESLRFFSWNPRIFKDLTNVNKHRIPTPIRLVDLTLLKAVNARLDWDPKAAPKLDFDEDYYSVLEISEKCDSNQLKKQYYKLVFKYHPDNKKSDTEKELCNRQMMVINNAYKVLKEDHTRAQYDSQRAIGNFGKKARVKFSSQTTEADDRNTESNSSGKSSTSTTSTSNSKSTSYAGPRRPSSSSSSSSSSYSGNTASSYGSSDMNDFFKRVYDKSASGSSTQAAVGEAESPVESIGDILSDLWRDISMDGGRHVLEDLVDFLEEKVKRTRFIRLILYQTPTSPLP